MEQAVARALSIESFQPSSLDSSFYVAVEQAVARDAASSVAPPEPNFVYSTQLL